MIKVTFCSEDEFFNQVFPCKFRSMKLADQFIENYQYLGGFNRFGADVWGETTQDLPIIPCNFRGFKIVYNNLYPKG